MVSTKRERGFFARGVATLAACLLLSQIVLAGLAAAAVSGGGQGVFFGAACAPPPAANGVSSGDTQPSAPSSGRHHGLCCVLHCGAMGAPAVKPVSPVLLNYPASAMAPAPLYRVDGDSADPELAPLSPRAPPARAV